jgi:hypothetical protein
LLDRDAEHPPFELDGSVTRPISWSHRLRSIRHDIDGTKPEVVTDGRK